MRFTLGTDASTLTHPVQLCLASIPMIMPSTYRKCIHSLSSKTITPGYDSLKNVFPLTGISLRALHPKSYHYSVKRYYLFLCFGTSQYHLCYQVVPVLSLLHSIIDGVHSERNYKFQQLAYDLPTCPSTLSALVFFRRSTAQDDT